MPPLKFDQQPPLPPGGERPLFIGQQQNRANMKSVRMESVGSKIMSTLGLPIFIICAVVIVFIVCSKRLREKKSNQLLLNLCIGHLLTGLACFYGLFSKDPVEIHSLRTNVQYDGFNFLIS